MSDYTYPVELIKKAEARIRAQLDGNGMDPKGISLNVKRQGIGIFTAETRYDADVKIVTTSEKGKKTKGQLVDTGKTQSDVKSYVSQLQSKDTLDATAREHIKSLPLKGFGTQNLEIGLKGEKKIFTEHQQCGRCKGQCKSQCRTCQGRGQAPCQMCHSHGFIQCLFCHGRGQIQENESLKHCIQCQGKGQTFCTHCNGQKQTPCTLCGAQGMTTCIDCNGEGANSTHTTVEPFLKIASAINIQELDDEPKIYASKAGALNLVKGAHIDIEDIKAPEVEEVERAYYEQEPEDNTKNTVYYQATMPWAAAEVQINGNPYKIAFVGKKGAICDSGHFMDDLLKSQLQSLSDAAQGNGFVTGLIKEACEARVSRETLSAVATMPRKKAMIAILKKYNIGLTKQTAQIMVQNSYLALKRVTRRPRYIGLLIGLTIASALFYYWFLMNGRVVTDQFDENIRYGLDVIPLVFSIILTMVAIKGTAYFAFQSVMRDINIKTKKMPPLGRAGIYGFVGNLLLWGGVFGLWLIN